MDIQRESERAVCVRDIESYLSNIFIYFPGLTPTVYRNNIIIRESCVCEG